MPRSRIGERKGEGRFPKRPYAGGKFATIYANAGITSRANKSML
jgi:hypothetical protein